jgi:hypothetical protein
MPEFVKIINEDTKPFDFHQNNAKRIVEPGGDVIVPWGIACTLFGNPNIPDIPPANERTRMYAKLRSMYNFGAGLHQDERWEDRRPKVRVFDLEGNAEIIMLIDDPEGKHMGVFNPNKSPDKQTDVDALQRQIAVLTQQVTRLVNREQATPAANAPGTTNSPTAVEDGPGGDVDSVFNLPTVPTADDSDTATADNPQAVPTGEIEEADDDSPPDPTPRKTVAKKVAAAPK